MSNPFATPPPPPPAAPFGGAPTGAPVVARRRRVWPWVVGGIAVLLGLIALVAAGLFWAFSALWGLTDGPRDAVLTFDRAWAEVDCDLYESVTASSVREEAIGGEYSCDAWEDVADTLIVDGVYEYSMEITSTEISNGRATVVATEISTATDETVTWEVEYELRQTDDGWIITGIDYDEQD